MLKKKSVCCIEIGLLLLLSLLFSAAAGLERQQQRISDSMIRLHVVAASDSDYDQDIKLRVRDAVLAQAQMLLQSAESREDAMACLSSGLPALSQSANWHPPGAGRIGGCHSHTGSGVVRHPIL